MRLDDAHSMRTVAPGVFAFAVLVYLAYYLVAGHADRLFTALLPGFS